MKLRGIDFGHTFVAPGTRGFFGEGYWFHWLLKLWGVDFSTPTFVAKTVTRKVNAGNTPLSHVSWQPKERFPRSIYFWPWSGHTVNAVGLTNFGAQAFLDRVVSNLAFFGIRGPWMMSFMAKGATSTDRLTDTRYFVEDMKEKVFRLGPVALQANYACPNTNIDPTTFYEEIEAGCRVLRALGVPIVLNLNALTPLQVLRDVKGIVDAFWIGNTIPWGSTSRIDWNKLTPDCRSPLPRRLGDIDPKVSQVEQEGQYQRSMKKGGLSGPMCLPLTLDLVQRARKAGITNPIIAGNGVQSAGDVVRLWLAGANGVAIGTAYNLRFWRVNEIIRQSEGLKAYWDDPRYDEREEMYHLLVSCNRVVSID